MYQMLERKQHDVGVMLDGQASRLGAQKVGAKARRVPGSHGYQPTPRVAWYHGVDRLWVRAWRRRLQQG